MLTCSPTLRGAVRTSIGICEECYGLMASYRWGDELLQHIVLCGQITPHRSATEGREERNEVVMVLHRSTASTITR